MKNLIRNSVIVFLALSSVANAFNPFVSPEKEKAMKAMQKSNFKAAEKHCTNFSGVYTGTCTLNGQTDPNVNEVEIKQYGCDYISFDGGDHYEHITANKHESQASNGYSFSDTTQIMWAYGSENSKLVFTDAFNYLYSYTNGDGELVDGGSAGMFIANMQELETGGLFIRGGISKIIFDEEPTFSYECNYSPAVATAKVKK